MAAPANLSAALALAAAVGVVAMLMPGTARKPATSIAVHVDVQRFIVSPS